MNHNDEWEQELNRLRSQGLERRLFQSETNGAVNFSSNDYLGLARHPEVIAAAVSAAEKHGIGGASSRLLAGTKTPHTALENELARFFFKERALVFSSGYHTNVGVISALAGPSDIVFADRLCHASIFDGIKLSGARLSAFDHNDRHHLKELLTKRRKEYRRALVITEGIFSMDGDLPLLTALVSLAKQHEALVYLDEAHSLGVMGPQGRGTAAELGVLSEIDVLVGTLSKTLGSQGGFVAGSKEMIDLLISRSRAFIYTTALAPACAAAAEAALSLLPRLDDRRSRILNYARELKDKLSQLGFSCLNSQSQIVPVWSGDVESTKKLSDHLLSRGFFVPSIRPPTVPTGEGRVRLSLSFEAVRAGITEIAGAFSSCSFRPRRAEEKIGQIG